MPILGGRDHLLMVVCAGGCRRFMDMRAQYHMGPRLRYRQGLEETRPTESALLWNYAKSVGISPSSVDKW